MVSIGDRISGKYNYNYSIIWDEVICNDLWWLVCIETTKGRETEEEEGEGV